MAPSAERGRSVPSNVRQQTCAAWSFVNDTRECTRFSDFGAVPPAANSADPADGAGVQGAWAKEGDECLMLKRPGTHAAAGRLALWLLEFVEANGALGEVSVGTADSLSELWPTFEATGTVSARLNGTHGVMAVSVSGLPPGEDASFSISLGWFMPARDFMGAKIGNHYATHVDDSAAAARLLLDDDALPRMSTRESLFVPSCWRGRWQELVACVARRLAPELAAPHTIAHVASRRPLEAGGVLLVRQRRLGTQRRERHLPYSMLWPEGVLSKMRAWASGQLDDGMIQEQLACGCMAAVPPKLDEPCGRVMGDVSSMFIEHTCSSCGSGRPTGRW